MGGKTATAPSSLNSIIERRCSMERWDAKNIPQIDVSGMTDEQKAKIPPINRLEATPTGAEAKVLEFFLRGPEALDDPGYSEAIKKLNEKRKK